MAARSSIIGRTTCPECGFASAHVKQSDKCTYRYCPECNSQHYARTDRQKADLLAKTRRTDAPAPTTGSGSVGSGSVGTDTGSGAGSADTATATVPEAVPVAPVVARPAPAAPKRRGLF